MAGMAVVPAAAVTRAVAGVARVAAMVRQDNGVILTEDVHQRAFVLIVAGPREISDIQRLGRIGAAETRR